MEGGIFRVPVDGGPPVIVAADALFADDCGGRTVLAYRRAIAVPDRMTESLRRKSNGDAGDAAIADEEI